jgi:RNA polymerase sigma factor (sigma-70 family)
MVFENSGGAKSPMQVLASMDDLLLPFIEESDEDRANFCLTRLIDDHAAPIVREILGSSLRFHFDVSGAGSSNPDAGDLFNDIVVNLISRLRQIKRNPALLGIADFRSYVASTAYNACNLYLRQKFPRRSRLKNRLRYLLSHYHEFALWTTDASGLLCGRAQWREQTHWASAGLLERIRQDPGEWMQEVGLTSAGCARGELATLLEAIFQWTVSPIKLDDLVNIVADICREKDLPDEPIETVMNVAAPVPTFETTLELQRSLRILWLEICQLPPRQRVALLLNFRDSHGQELISLFPHTRVATIEQIAEILEFPLAEFLKLWNDLPLDDLAIAERLGATRQQVINLRKCARERLERRMSAAMTKNYAGK